MRYLSPIVLLRAAILACFLNTLGLSGMLLQSRNEFFLPVTQIMLFLNISSFTCIKGPINNYNAMFA